MRCSTHPDIAAVAIATPAESHARLALAGARGGQARLRREAAGADGRARPRTCRARPSGNAGSSDGRAPAAIPPGLPAAARSWCARASSGRLQYIYSNRLNLGKIRREENILWSFAPHDISMILSLAGEMPEQVAGDRRLLPAQGDRRRHHDPPRVSRRHQRAHLRLLAAPVQGAEAGRRRRRRHGGVRRRRAVERKLLLYPHRIDWRERPAGAGQGRGRARSRSRAAEPLRLECRHFLDCVATRRRRRAPMAREGLRVLRVLRRRRALDGRRGRRDHAGAGASGRRSRCVRPRIELRRRPAARSAPARTIWHFSHILRAAGSGGTASIGQNVMIGPDVSRRRPLQDPEQRQPLQGRDARGRRVLRPVLRLHQRQQPARRDRAQGRVPPDAASARGATIGANATIVCGHDIGEYASSPPAPW